MGHSPRDCAEKKIVFKDSHLCMSRSFLAKAGHSSWQVPLSRKRSFRDVLDLKQLEQVVGPPSHVLQSPSHSLHTSASSKVPGGHVDAQSR